MSNDVIPSEIIESKIYYIRGQKVMLDSDLAKLYNVETKRINESIKRNMERFPKNFMFQLTDEEHDVLRSQIATSKEGKGGRRYNPYVFTEYGIVMLSSVLNSKRAIAVNIQVVNTFVKLNKMIATSEELKRKIEEIELKYDKQFTVVFQALKELILLPDKKQEQIGFKVDKF